ncbi:MAG: CRTAC1 family protein, partial [Gammaproteobacteria bacterium]|nr:CRTAC1 family protein [Gammaproteobacteria bacterium]
LRLEDDGKNADAIGAVVELHDSDGRIQRQRVAPGRSYLSQVELPLTFGLGEASVTTVRVTWPDGASTEFNSLLQGQSYVLSRSGAKPD